MNKQLLIPRALKQKENPVNEIRIVSLFDMLYPHVLINKHMSRSYVKFQKRNTYVFWIIYTYLTFCYIAKHCFGHTYNEMYLWNNCIYELNYLGLQMTIHQKCV